MNETLSELREQTIWGRVLASAERVPDRAALVGGDDTGRVQRVTYADLIDRVTALSGGFAEIGVQRGDRMMLWITNSIDWVITALAAMRIGAAVVPANTFFKPAEIDYILRQSGARHVVMLDQFRALRMPIMFAEICPEFESATEPGVLFSRNLPDVRNVVVFNRSGGRHHGAFDLAELETSGRSLAARALATRLAAAVTGNDLGMVKFTSGSTAFPKGVMLEQGGFVANAVVHSRRVGVDGSDIWFSMMPFFHAGGSIWGLMTMIVNGGTLVFTEAFIPRLGAKLIEQEKATVMFGVLPDELLAAAVEDGRDLSSLRIGPVYSDLARKMMPNVTFSISPFGLTESFGSASANSPDDPPGKLGMNGRPYDGNVIRCVDPETGLDSAPGVAGEAWVRGNVMSGYWNNPEETARALDNAGWLHTADLITMDEDGYVRFVGRIKLMIKVGGENVSLEEVENVVASHPAVIECGAVGVPDLRKDEVVRTYVALHKNEMIDEKDLREWLAARLARFKVPRDIVFLEQLPKLGNGKLDRVTLRHMADAEVAAV